MVKEMIVNTTALETKVAILEDDQLAELYIERNRSRGILGNIYKGKVTKVLPGMQSAFVNIGWTRTPFSMFPISLRTRRSTTRCSPLPRSRWRK